MKDEKGGGEGALPRSVENRNELHSGRSLRRDAQRAGASCGPSPGRSCGPPMASAIAIRTWDRRFSPQPSGRACDQREQPSAKGRLRAAAQYVRASEFADGQELPTRRCRPPPDAADGTRRSNGVPRQDGITRSIDCSVFLFGQRHKSPSREPRYGFRLFAMIFKTSLAELYRAYSPYNKFRNLFLFIQSFSIKSQKNQHRMHGFAQAQKNAAARGSRFVRAVPRGGKHARRHYLLTAFRPTMAPINNVIKKRRAAVSGSSRKRMPSTTVPTAPIPVQTG